MDFLKENCWQLFLRCLCMNVFIYIQRRLHFYGAAAAVRYVDSIMRSIVNCQSLQVLCGTVCLFRQGW